MEPTTVSGVHSRTQTEKLEYDVTWGIEEEELC